MGGRELRGGSVVASLLQSDTNKRQTTGHGRVHTEKNDSVLTLERGVCRERCGVLGGRGEGSKRWAVEDSARPPNDIQQKAATYPLTLPAWTMHRALVALLVLLLAVLSVAGATFEVGIPEGNLAPAGSSQVRCPVAYLPLRPLPAALTDSEHSRTRRTEIRSFKGPDPQPSRMLNGLVCRLPPLSASPAHR